MQSDLPFINSNRKTHIHMNKFVEATINTYNKKIQFWLQNTSWEASKLASVLILFKLNLCGTH